MKKLTIAAGALALVPALALAAGNHPMAGCGLGYILFSNKDNTKVTQVLGATTNGTFGSQTFGISSGTSGCTEDGAVKWAKETEVFAEVNLPNLRREIAQGQGEYLTAFATLLGVNEYRRPALFQFMKANYQQLFPADHTTSTEMLRSLSTELSQHPEVLG